MLKGGSNEHEQSNIDLVDFDSNGDSFVDLA